MFFNNLKFLKFLKLKTRFIKIENVIEDLIKYNKNDYFLKLKLKIVK